PEQGPAGLTVTVLPGQRPAVGRDEVRRTLVEAGEGRHPLRGDQVEGDADVQAALTEVSADRGAAEVELVEETAQVAQVVTEALRVDRGVLPPRPGVAHVRWPGRRPEPGLAGRPDLLLGGPVVGEGHTGAALAPAQGLQEIIGPGVGLLR